MNYNSVEELFNAGTTNMSIIRDNSTITATVQLTGVDWFTYDGRVASNIYVSGRSYFGFNYSAAQLQVNNNNQGGVSSIFREEGTVLDIKFLKIRFFCILQSSDRNNKTQFLKI